MAAEAVAGAGPRACPACKDTKAKERAKKKQNARRRMLIGAACCARPSRVNIRCSKFSGKVPGDASSAVRAIRESPNAGATGHRLRRGTLYQQAHGLARP